MTEATNGNLVQMGVIGAPHGVAGEVRVKTFTGDPVALGDYGPLTGDDGKRYTVRTIRPAKGVVVVRFAEIASREQAEAANGIALFLPRDALPQSLDTDEYYHADLVGLRVVDDQGNSYGQVKAVHDFGGGDVLELAGKRAGMIPFTRAAVPRVDIEGRKLVVDPVAAGLADIPDGGNAPDTDGPDDGTEPSG